MTGDRRFLFTAFWICLLSLRASSLLSQTPVVIANCVLEDRTIAEVFKGTQLPKLIADDRGLLLGGVSDIYRDSRDPAGEFWVVTDRGPNGKMKVDGVKSYTFPLPAFTPLLVHVKIDQNRLRVLKALPLVGNSGKAISGLPNRREEGGVPYDIAGRNELPLDVNGLDVEGMVRMSDGSFWLADEYGPSIVHVDSTGRILKRFLPAQTDADPLDLIDPKDQVAYVLPAIYRKREPNGGFESLAISPDERTLYAAFQSPLLTNDHATSSKKYSRNTRILAFDIALQSPVAEYIYQLGERTADGRLPDPRDFEIGAIATISDSKLLVLEHNGGPIAKLYRVDLRSATNTIISPHHSLADGESIESIDDLPSRNIEPLEKQLVADLGKMPNMPGKLEGLTIVDAQTVAVANDNDFGFDNFTIEGKANRNALKSHLLIVKLPLSLDEQ